MDLFGKTPVDWGLFSLFSPSALQEKLWQVSPGGTLTLILPHPLFLLLLLFIWVLGMSKCSGWKSHAPEWNSASVGSQGSVLGGGKCGKFGCSPGAGHGLGVEFLGEVALQTPEFQRVGFSAYWWHSEYKNKIPLLICPWNSVSLWGHDTGDKTGQLP